MNKLNKIKVGKWFFIKPPEYLWIKFSKEIPKVRKRAF